MATQTETQSSGITSDPVVFTAVVVGAVLTLVGVVAPVLVGASGEFVIFGRNYAHDAFHLATGVGGLLAGYYAGGKFARSYAIGFGVVYFLLTVAGVVAFGLMRELIALNVADNALHLMLAIVLLGVGMIFGSQR